MHTLVPAKPFRSWLVQRLIVILVLIGLAAAGSILITYVILSSRNDILSAMSDAGKLRQTTQSLLLLAERVQSIPPNEAEDYPGRREDLLRFRTICVEFEAVLDRISNPNGPYEPLVKGPLLAVLDYPPVSARRHLFAFAQAARDFHKAAAANDSAKQGAVLVQMMSIGLGDALNAGNALSSALEQAGLAYLDRLKLLQIAALLELLLLIPLGTVLLIRPLLRKVDLAETSIARLRFVVEGAREGVLITDTSGRIVWANQAMTRISGYSFEELIGSKPGRLLQGPNTDRSVVEEIRNALKAERPIVRELLNYSKSGRPYWVRLSIVPRRDDRGEIAEYVAIETDVTEARESEARERAALQTLIDAVSSLSEGFTYFDAQDRLVIWNRQFAAMLPEGGSFLREGMTFEQMLDASIAHSKPESEFEDVETFRQVRLARHLTPGEPFEQKVQFDRYFLVNERRTKDGGTVAIYADITAIRRVELAEAHARAEAEQTARTRAEFLAVMSHEIRTPLNGVLGMLDLALDGPLSPEQRTRLKTAFASAESLVGLIEDVLDFSRMEAGRLELHLAPLSPRALASEVEGLIRPKLKNRPVNIALHIDENVPDGLNADAGRLRQILINLLDNAAKFTEEGHIALSLSWQANGNRLIARVEDTGIGIPLHRLSEVFLDFRQIDPARTRKVGGAGLGLAITKRLVEAMGGSIGVESQPGQGTVFTVELPLEPCGIDFSKDTRIPDGEKDLSGLHILLAEDSPTNRMVAEAILTRAGASVDLADDGRAALRMTQSVRYDVICMDVAMPGIDGLETTRWIREMSGPNANTAIVAVTAHAMPGDRDRYKAAGMDGYVSKPLKSGSLEREIVRVLGLRKVGQSSPPSGNLPSLPAEPVEERANTAPPPPAEPAAPAMDPTVLDLLAQDIPADALARMIAAFLSELELRVRSYGEAIEAGQWQLAARECHTLKSAAANLGAMAVSARAQAAEQTAKGEDLAASQAAHEALREAAAEAGVALGSRRDAFLADQAASR